MLALILCGICWAVPHSDCLLGNKPWPQLSSAIFSVPNFLASPYAVDPSPWLFKLPPLFLLQFHGTFLESWRPELQTVLKIWPHSCYSIAAKLCLLSCSKTLFWWCPAFRWFWLLLHTEVITSDTCQGWLQGAFPELWMVIQTSTSWGTAQIILCWYNTLNLSTLKPICHLPSLLSFATFLLSSEVPPARWRWCLTTQNSFISSSDLEISLHTPFYWLSMKTFNKTSANVYPSGTLL